MAAFWGVPARRAAGSRSLLEFHEEVSSFRAYIQNHLIKYLPVRRYEARCEIRSALQPLGFLAQRRFSGSGYQLQ
jgi:hypothetical protein